MKTLRRARARRTYGALDGISLGNGRRGELFEDVADLVLNVLVVVEGVQFALGVGGTAGPAVEIAQAKVGGDVGGVVLDGALEEGDGVGRAVGRNQDDGQAGFG